LRVIVDSPVTNPLSNDPENDNVVTLALDIPVLDQVLDRPELDFIPDPISISPLGSVGF
jgi:hypothetical protein